MKFDMLIIQALLVTILTYISDVAWLWEIAQAVLIILLVLHTVFAITSWWMKRRAERVEEARRR